VTPKAVRLLVTTFRYRASCIDLSMFDRRKPTVSWKVRLANLWRGVRHALFPSRLKKLRFERVLVFQSGEATPKHLSHTDMVLIRSGTRDKWLRFACPNGCGGTVMLDLSPTRQPRWSLDMHTDGTITVYPSVVNRECGAHFLIRRNRITWI
jgi:hypothetical protein